MKKIISILIGILILQGISVSTNDDIETYLATHPDVQRQEVVAEIPNYTITCTVKEVYNVDDLTYFEVIMPDNEINLYTIYDTITDDVEFVTFTTKWYKRFNYNSYIISNYILSNGTIIELN